MAAQQLLQLFESAVLGRGVACYNQKMAISIDVIDVVLLIVDQQCMARLRGAFIYQSNLP